MKGSQTALAMCSEVQCLSDADMEKSKKGQRVEALYRDAAQSYQEAGRHQAAAEALGRAAIHLEGIEPEVSWLSSGWEALPYHLTLCSIRVYISLTRRLCCMQASSQLYMDAIDILADQEEGKEGLSGDLFRQAIG